MRNKISILLFGMLLLSTLAFSLTLVLSGSGTVFASRISTTAARDMYTHTIQFSQQVKRSYPGGSAWKGGYANGVQDAQKMCAAHGSKGQFYKPPIGDPDEYEGYIRGFHKASTC